MKRTWLALALTMAVAAALLGATACDDNGGDAQRTPAATAPSGAASEVTVVLTEYEVTPDVDTVPAGTVVFTAQNIGTTEHELMVHRMEAGVAVPTKEDGSVDEEAAGVEMIGEVDEIAAGESKDLTVELEAGDYMLLCNVVQTDGETISHYAEGMWTTFAVAVIE